MADYPLVSILMTSYNRELYIEEAIKSVLHSTYENLELIIVDDNSKDNTVQIARSFELTDARVKVYVNSKNLGDYPNRNMAASYARGKYLKYVDADDYIYPWGIELLVRMMEQFPGAGWGLCSLNQDDSKPFPFVLSPTDAYKYHYNGPGLFHKAPLSAIIKRESFQTISGFREIRMAGDFDMWHRLAKLFPVVLMPHGIVWYRKHGNQEVNSFREYLHVYERIKKEHLEDTKTPLSETEKVSIIKSISAKKIKSIVRSVVKFKIPQAVQEYKLLSIFKK